MNLFNINPNYNFLESLAVWVLQNFSTQRRDTLLILPNKRSCLEFKNIHQNLKTGFECPKVAAISDISPHHIKFINKNIPIKEKTYEIFKKESSDLKYSFELSGKIRGTAFFKISKVTKS